MEPNFSRYSSPTAFADAFLAWWERFFWVRRFSPQDEADFRRQFRRNALNSALIATALYGVTVATYIYVATMRPAAETLPFGGSMPTVPFPIVLAIAWGPFLALRFLPREWVEARYEWIILIVFTYFLVRLLGDVFLLPNLFESIHNDLSVRFGGAAQPLLAVAIRRTQQANLAGLQTRLLTIYTFLVVFFRIPYRTALVLCLFTLVPALLYLSARVPGGIYVAINVCAVIILALIASWMLEDRERRIFLEKGRSAAMQAAALRELQNELERAHKARTGQQQFMRHAVHDVKNQFWAFGNYLSVWEKMYGHNEAIAKRAMAGLSQAYKSVAALTSKLLDISEIESGSRKPSIQAVELLSLLEGVHTMLVANADQKGTGLRLDIPREEAPVLVMTDPTWLTQILLNLVGNAIKFTAPRPDGTAGVEFGVLVKGFKSTVFIYDTGIGIPEASRTEIWDYGVTQRGTNDEPGTGIGLPLVRTLCSVLGHDIRMSSVEGAGTQFWIELPICRDESLIAQFKGAGREPLELS